MGLHDTVSWYQRKIGTYDKQQWEKTVEQRILAGFKHVLTKTAKLKTDLIDVDLVRGSSFSKTKPKHGLATVARLAVVRCVFLPLYYSWWIQQTCGATYALLLVLYLLQIGNMTVYLYFTSASEALLTRVSLYELLVPAVMMIVLSLIHSEIVATSTGHTQERINRKRGRRGQKRRLERKNTDTAESGSGFGGKKTSPEPATDRAQPEGAAVATSGLRQRNVAWRAPLREPAPPPPPRSVDDDGFESLASHASSEDGGREQGEKREPAGDSEQVENGCTNGHQLLPGMGVGGCCPKCRGDPATQYTDTDSDLERVQPSPQRLLQRRRSLKPFQPLKTEHYDSSGESEACASPPTGSRRTPGAGQSGHEWLGVTTNSEECSVESGGDDSSDGLSRQMDDHPFAWEFQMSPSSTLSPSCTPSDRVSCTIWEGREVKRADLSVLDISSAIIARVESMPDNLDYFYGGLFISIVISLVPSLCRLLDTTEGEQSAAAPAAALPDLTNSFSYQLTLLMHLMFGDTPIERVVTVIALVERFCLACLFFFIAAVAERTLKQRFLYAKLFSQLTSFRRARRSQLPHFRLNKVRNIKTWLSVRSYLKKRGPQRSVDVIVSAAFIITLLLLSFLTVELLKDSARLQSEYNLEALLWCLGLGIFMLRFMTLGNKTNRKYRNPSVLLTEQINLYLQIEQKPNKKDELMVANCVLKLAADLLKELESPFKISGLSANPYLYTITKVVILSALSGVLSEMLGFKLKLHNIKISAIK